MKVLTLGDGFIANHLNYDKITEKVQLHWSETKAMLSHHRPDVLINCLGRTGRPNVDWCEKNKLETAEGNVSIPVMLAELCSKLYIHMIHIGSGCIYFGESPHKEYVDDGNLSLGGFTIDHGWKEDDFANPQSYYSQTKYACDLAIGSYSNVSILRIRMPISNKNEPRNLINKLRGYSEIIDIPNSVTFIHDLKRCVNWVAKEKVSGIYHVVNPQPLTAARIMREYQKHLPNHQFTIITEEQLNQLTIAKRSNCILNTDKLNNAGFHMTPAEEALEQCMNNYMDK